MSPSTALPTQIFIWFDSPERGFVARTSAAIIVLLGFLILMNAAGRLPAQEVRTQMVTRDPAGRGAAAPARPCGAGPRRAGRRPASDGGGRARAAAAEPRAATAAKMAARDVNLWYGEKQALFDVSLDIAEHEVTALIGPSGCGKSTFLRCLNRMNDVIDTCRVEGDDPPRRRGHLRPQHRRRAAARAGSAWCSRSPTRSPSRSTTTSPTARASTASRARKAELDEIVERSLEAPACGRRSRTASPEPGNSLSGGQQQRLCIARAIAVSPEVILMDEPCSALDPIATAHIEELIDELRQNFTIAIVTHNMQQAARVSQKTAFFHLGKLIEFDDTDQIFTNPKQSMTQDYITGRFG